MRPRRNLVLIAAGAALVVNARVGRAQEDYDFPDDRSAPTPVPVVDTSPRTPPVYVFELGGRAGFATVPIRGGVNPFGPGLGARAGLVLSNVYFGATVMSYFGDSDGGATDQALLFGLEAGYGIHVGPYFTLRPQLGLGDMILSHTEPPPATGRVDVVTSASGSGGGALSTTTHVANIYLQPALIGQVAWQNYFVALDLSIVAVPGITYGPAPAEATTWLSYSLGAQVGFRL